MSRSRLARLIARAALLAVAALAAAAGYGETIVAGVARDATTEGLVAGARVTLQRGNEIVATGVTGADGSFVLPFNVPVSAQALQLKLFVRLDDYIEGSRDVTITSGRPDANAYLLTLVPRSLAECIRARDHMVVVGYFRPPAASAADQDLADRVADALNYDLLVRMQQGRLVRDALPIIVACGKARPQSSGDYTNYAKVLHADAFLTGYVDDPGTHRVKVQMSVADRFGLLIPPLRASSPEVNLDDPAVARLDPSAHAAILTALVAGYERAGKYADCIEFAVAAARILATLPPAIADARRRCEQAVPNARLVQ